MKKKRTKRERKGKRKIAIKNRREKKKNAKKAKRKKVYGNSIIPDNGRGHVFQQAFVSRADMNQL